MSKIGILTFHRSLNYGAFMQAYSLSKKLSEDFPDDTVELVDYCVARMQHKYSYQLFTYIFSSVSSWKEIGVKTVCKATIKNCIQVARQPQMLTKRKQMRVAFNSALEYAPLSAESLCTDDCTEAIRWLQDRYDVLVVGSDCVWEFINYPFPNVYFLHDLKNVRKMSYAACAQGILFERLKDYQKTYLKESWEQFEYLGVRDYATEQLVQAVDPALKIHHNCDPTVFLNMDWIPVDMPALKKKFEAAGVDFSRPAVCLMGNEYVGKICREVMGDQYQIVAVFEENAYADCFVYDLTPFEWAKCFSLFQLTFTNRFHGTLLSLQNGVSTITFDFAAADHSFSNKGITKIRDLYDRLGLIDGHYFIGKKTYSAEEIQNVRGCVEQHLSVDEKGRIAEALQKESSYYDGLVKAIRQKQ